MASGDRVGGHLAVALALVCLNFSPALHAQTLFRLSDRQIAGIEQTLRTALVNPAETAFLQVLVDVRLRPNDDDDSVYDIEVRYDPDRYRNPHTGTYPLSFADQFIVWGKRLTLFSYGTKWRSGHFHLRDIANGQQAWIPLEDARRLVPKPDPLPGQIGTTPSDLSGTWRRLLYALTPQTDIRSMARWFRLMRRQARPNAPLKGAPAPPPAPQTTDSIP